VPSTVTTPYEFAQELLELAEEALATTTGGVPDRRFVTYALPTDDCDDAQLTVHIGQLAIDQLQQPVTPPVGPEFRVQNASVNLLTLNVRIVRCVPTMNGQTMAPPSPEAIEAAAAVIFQDGWAIWNHLKRQINAGAVWEGRCSGVIVQSAVPVPDNGGVAGWEIPVTTWIQGYQPV
jgi:hypothetical protein